MLGLLKLGMIGAIIFLVIHYSRKLFGIGARAKQDIEGIQNLLSEHNKADAEGKADVVERTKEDIGAKLLDLTERVLQYHNKDKLSKWMSDEEQNQAIDIAQRLRDKYDELQKATGKIEPDLNERITEELRTANEFITKATATIKAKEKEIKEMKKAEKAKDKTTKKEEAVVKYEEAKTLTELKDLEQVEKLINALTTSLKVGKSSDDYYNTEIDKIIKIFEDMKDIDRNIRNIARRRGERVAKKLAEKMPDLVKEEAEIGAEAQLLSKDLKNQIEWFKKLKKLTLEGKAGRISDIIEYGTRLETNVKNKILMLLEEEKNVLKELEEEDKKSKAEVAVEKEKIEEAPPGAPSS